MGAKRSLYHGGTIHLLNFLDQQTLPNCLTTLSNQSPDGSTFIIELLSIYYCYYKEIFLHLRHLQHGCAINVLQVGASPLETSLIVHNWIPDPCFTNWLHLSKQRFNGKRIRSPSMCFAHEVHRPSSGPANNIVLFKAYLKTRLCHEFSFRGCKLQVLNLRKGATSNSPYYKSKAYRNFQQTSRMSHVCVHEVIWPLYNLYMTFFSTCQLSLS